MKICNNCGHNNVDDSRYCVKCGTPLASSADIASDAAEVPSESLASSPEANRNIEEMQSKIDRLQRQVDRANAKDDDGGCVVEFFLFLIAAVVLWIFCPSDQKMTTEISREVSTQAIQYVGHLMELDHFNPNADHMDNDEVVKFAERYGSISIKNYGLVKLGYFKRRGMKKEHLAGIGICGFVITKSLVDKISTR